MIYTAVDGKKTFSVEKQFLKNTWNPTQKTGRKICVIPSDFCLVRIEQAFSRKISHIKNFYALDVEQKYGKVNWDLSVYQDKVFLGVYRDYPSKDCINVELEVFALTRVLQVMGCEDAYLLDMGRRKTTVVSIKGGLLHAYRVLMKGGDFLTQIIAETRNLDFQRAEELKKEKGLDLEEAKRGIQEILSSLGFNLTDKQVLLSGGGSKIKGIEELFSKTLKNHYCDPALNTAFGASLKFFVKNPYPDFVEREISKEQLKTASLLAGSSVLLFLGSYILTGMLWSWDGLRSLEREEFKKTFPGTPIVSLYDQVRSKVSAEEPYELTKKLSELPQKLKPDIKVYSIEFSNGILTISGEGKEEVVNQINPQKIKKTPTGSVEFELEIK
jgi:hypothetical protein